MRKLFLTIWGINTVALVWLLGSILLSGSTSNRRNLAGDLAEIWAGLAAVYVLARFASKGKAKQEQEKERRLMRSAVKDRTSD
jgi:CRISPR/Cas system-associated endonuclease Cas1